MSEQVKKQQVPRTHPEQLSAFQQYLYANLLWWGFLVVLAIISFFTCGAVWDDVTEGVMEFIFFILGGGFILVTLLDYLYEKYIGRTIPEGKP